MTIVIYGTPVPQGSTRAFVKNGRAVVTSDNKRLKPWRQQLTDTLFYESGYLPYSGDGQEPVCLTLDFFFKRPKSAPKKREAMTVRPDLDKLTRAVLDAGTGILYKDDAQVTGIITRKHYDAVERVEIQVIAEYGRRKG